MNVDSLALFDRVVGQADDGEARRAARDLDLDVHGHGLDALEGDGGNAGDQGGSGTEEPP